MFQKYYIIGGYYDARKIIKKDRCSQDNCEKTKRFERIPEDEPTRIW